jgi:uncharacterized glyoxalase superfamily metalloenzyme YdcJ
VKRKCSVSATDSYGTTVEVVAHVNTSVLNRSEVEILLDDLRDRLMGALPGIRYTTFRLSKIKVG